MATLASELYDGADYDEPSELLCVTRSGSIEVIDVTPLGLVYGKEVCSLQGWREKDPYLGELAEWVTG